MKATLAHIQIRRNRAGRADDIEPAFFWFYEGFSIYVTLDEVRRFVEKRRDKIHSITKGNLYSSITFKS